MKLVADRIHMVQRWKYPMHQIRKILDQGWKTCYRYDRSRSKTSIPCPDEYRPGNWDEISRVWNLVAPLIESIKTHQKKIESLREENTDLRMRIEALEKYLK